MRITAICAFPATVRFEKRRRRTAILYHATSCVFEGALWMKIGRRMRRPGDRRGLDLVPGLPS